MEYKIEHNETENRFEAQIGCLVAVVEYRKVDGYYIITHTGVPQSLEGRGVAAALNKALLDYIRAEGAKVRPLCPYTAAYIQKHAEYEDLLL